MLLAGIRPINTSGLISNPIVACLLATCLSLTATSSRASSGLSRHASVEHSTYSREARLEAGLSEVLPDPANAQLVSQNDGGLRHHPWQDDIAWISSIGTLLHDDADTDGYYNGFSLTVDADSAYQHIDVYLTIDVQLGGQHRERLHSGSDFTLYRQSLTDGYRIDIDLLRNYPAGHYDLWVELHDAYDHRTLDTVGADDFNNLYSLPLESRDMDYLPANLQAPRPANDDIAVTEHAGSAGFAMLILMGLISIIRINISLDKRAGQGV